MTERRLYGRDLVDAIMERDERKARRLLRKGANTDFVIKGDKAIHLAARYGLYKTLKYLLQEGDDVNKENEHGNTALHYAAREGREDIVELLIDSGADMNRQNMEGETPLHGCVGYQPMDVIERFVQMGMDVNKQTKYGDTPLHRAVEYCREESVEALLLCKADPYIKNERGKRPDQIAKVPSIGEQIRTHGIFSAAMESGYIQSQGMKLSHRDVRRPLHIERLGIVIEEMDLPDDFPTAFYCRREKSENTTIALHTNGDEVIVSDVFIFRVRDVYRDVDTKLTLPLYTKPSEKDDLFVKFPLKMNSEICDSVSADDKEVTCTISVTLVPETTVVFYLCVSPKAEVTAIGAGEGRMESEVDPGFSMEIPDGAFRENTTLSLKVYEAHSSKGDSSDEDSEEEGEEERGNNKVDPSGSHTADIKDPLRSNYTNGEINHAFQNHVDKTDDIQHSEQSQNASETSSLCSENVKQKKKKKEKRKKKKTRKKEDSLLLSDVYEIKLTGEQPTKGLKMQLPLKDVLNSDDELQVVRIDSDDENTIHALDTSVTVDKDGFAVFEANHFSMYCLTRIPKQRMGQQNLDSVREQITHTKERRQEARFFVMLRQLDPEDIHGRHVLLVECIRAGASGRRRKKWQRQGYEKQRPKNSKRMKLAPGQEFFIRLRGEARFDQSMDETGSRKITFSPHRASFQPYNIRLPPLYQTGLGSVLIYPLPTSKSESGETSASYDEENQEPIAELKIKLHLPPPEEPFSEYIETIASHRTFAEIRAAREKRLGIARKKSQRKRMEREAQVQEQVQAEIQEKGLPSRPKTPHEAARFNPPPLMKLDY